LYPFTNPIDSHKLFQHYLLKRHQNKKAAGVIAHGLKNKKAVGILAAHGFDVSITYLSSAKISVSRPCYINLPPPVLVVCV